MGSVVTHRSETAGRHLVQRVPIASAEEPVNRVLARLPGHEFDVADAVYVLNPAGQLVGSAPFTRLLAAPGGRLLGELMTANPPCVRPGHDQEQAALVAIRHGLPSVPVVDEGDRFLGAVPSRALLEVLWREHTEDVHVLAGVLRDGEQLHAAAEAPPAWRVIRRLPWLLAGLVGGAAATAVMTRFEQVLQARIAIAFFIPAIVYLADAVGTQTEAIMVRYLSAGRAPLWRLLRGELTTGLLIGLCLSVFVFPATLLAFGDTRLAVAVTISVAVAGLVASGVGLVLPWLLCRLGKDPAFGSGPVATIIQDVLSLLIYFAAVMLIVV